MDFNKKHCKGADNRLFRMIEFQIILNWTIISSLVNSGPFWWIIDAGGEECGEDDGSEEEAVATEQEFNMEGGIALGESFNVKVMWVEEYLPINNKAEILLVERLFLITSKSFKSVEKKME